MNWLFIITLAIPHSLVGPHFHYSPLSKYDNGYQESRYEWILDQIENIYGPFIEQRGGRFFIQRDWSDGAVNMWAWRMGDEYWLEVPGGMSRYYLINEEGFLHSICHEIGHLLGGAPGNAPISFEGQSDYFSSLKCMKRILSQIDPEKILTPTDEVIHTCENLDHLAPDICARSLLGALSLTSYYAELEKVSFPKISTPSTVIVNTTLIHHPPAQCRLDTMVAGLICNADIDEDLSFTNPLQGACAANPGARPTCWYRN